MTRHVVVIGHGMVGARFAEEVRRDDPDGRRVRLTILAAEPRPAYNRVLLPNLLSGVMVEEDFIPNGRSLLPARTSLRTGVAAVRLDPDSHTVATSAGDDIRYDALVLATGARPQVPHLPGVLAEAASSGTTGSTLRSDEKLAPDITVLRSIADARRLCALAQSARRRHSRIAVLGGGVLGLEAARALAARGTAVTVVHRGAHLMDRQLDAPGGRVLAAALRRTGVEVLLGAQATRWEPGRGLRLADGALVRCGGLLVSTGTAPESALARDAGLKLTDAGAVAVDDTLATSDPDVYAIGDCAGHPGAAGGLVQPGWEQAAVLASRLTGASPAALYAGSTEVTRLKAAGIDLTCLGSPFPEPGDSAYEVLRFEDPARERYAKLVLDGGRVAGAIVIGLPDAAAGLVRLYDRGAPAPADRLALLLGRALPPDGSGGPGGSGASAGPAALPEHAVVCRCNTVTKAQLRSAWYGGATSRAALSTATRAATGCGGCGDDLDALASWLTRIDPNRKEPALR
jgi:assimilatory nitrate reductase electron transfer subunit